MVDGQGFVRGPEPTLVTTLLKAQKPSLGKRLWTLVGYLIALGFVTGVLFLLGVACYAAWSAVVG